MQELQSLSLIKRDRATGMVSIHRLVQTHFKNFLGAEGRQNAFNHTSALVYRAFPERQPLLYGEWERCGLLMPHVLALKESFRRELQRNQDFRACWDFCEVATTAQRQV